MDDLESAGVRTFFDLNDNSAIGKSVSRFVSLAAEASHILVIGTTEYLAKYLNNVSPTGSIVAAEADIIQHRLTRTELEKESVLPVLRDGAPESSFPPLLRGRAYADFRREEEYFLRLYGLVLTLWGVPATHLAVRPVLASLMASVETQAKSAVCATS